MGIATPSNLSKPLLKLSIIKGAVHTAHASCQKLRRRSNFPYLITSPARPKSVSLGFGRCARDDYRNLICQGALQRCGKSRFPISWEVYHSSRREHMLWNAIAEWQQKRALRRMLSDPRATRGFRSVGQLEKRIGADRATTERLLLAIGARKSDAAEEWTLTPIT
jgi:hypothetical protein